MWCALLTPPRMLDRIAAKHGRKLIECRSGSSTSADLMMEHEILIGGEESGGIGILPLSAGTRRNFELRSCWPT